MTIDGRKLSRETLADIRIQAVQRVEDGESSEDVVDLLGFYTIEYIPLAGAIPRRWV